MVPSAKAVAKVKGRELSTSSEAIKKSAFLAAYTVKGTVEGACKVTGLGKDMVYQWLDSDQTFVLAREKAHKQYLDHLEAILDRETTGDKVNSILLMFKIKKEDPSYRDNIKIDQRIAVAAVDLTSQELEAIVKGTGKGLPYVHESKAKDTATDPVVLEGNCRMVAPAVSDDKSIDRGGHADDAGSGGVGQKDSDMLSVGTIPAQSPANEKDLIALPGETIEHAVGGEPT